MFDTTYNIPLIIKDPKSSRVNEQDDNLVYLHDLTSTVYDIAEQKFQPNSKGKRYYRSRVKNNKMTEKGF